jgi:excisionase family DNA binding protein
MTLPQRTATPALPRQVAYGQRPASRPGVPAGYPMARQMPAGARPQPGMAPMAQRPMRQHPMPERPAPRAVSFLTVAEVAAIMRVSKMTVYRLVHGGEMAAVRVGRSFRVPETAVREYLSEARTDVA